MNRTTAHLLDALDVVTTVTFFFVALPFFITVTGIDKVREVLR